MFDEMRVLSRSVWPLAELLFTAELSWAGAELLQSEGW
jgi:hypothetical protein